jgi:quinol monooxygenase YgiN
MPVVIVATIVPIAEHREAVIAALQAAVGHVHDEPGCELYALHEAADRLVLIEKWESPEALAAHREGAALAALGGALRGKVTGAPDVVLLQAVPGGEAAKGQL